MSNADFIKALQDEVNSKEYDNNSIGKLDEEQRVRTRPEALLGSKGIDGAKHTVIEIIGNATDERLSGFGDKLDVALYEDGSISVRDYGRGVPLGWNEEVGAWNFYLIYEELYAGGKYGDEERQAILRKVEEANAWDEFDLLDFKGMVSIGLNGLGAAATQCSSEHCEVVSYRNGTASRMLYKKGKHILDELEETSTDEPNGTFVKWKPDDEVFTDTKISSKWLKNLCKQVSIMSGFTVTFTNKGKEDGRWEAKTLEQEMIDSVGCAVYSTNKLHTTDKDGDICVCQAEIVLGKGGRGTEYFHNRVEVKGGAHASAYSNALYEFFSGISKLRSIKIKESDYSGKFSVILSTLSNKMSVRGQTKDYLDDSFISECLYFGVLDSLKTEYEKGSEWLVEIVEETITNAQNRIAVQEMSKNVKEMMTSIKKHKASNKFTPCQAYEEGKAEECEYYIVEGDSAGGKVLTARDAFYQCYQAIRGKSLNIYKAPISKLIANREIKDIVAALGCGIDLNIDEYESFDIRKLKVGKIIFLADADIDGKHITMLLLLIFYRLFPELLYQGKVYIVDTPLYAIYKNDDDIVYCMDEDDFAKKKDEIGMGNIRDTARFKGLGEMEDDDLWWSVLNPETRHLRQIKLERNDTELTDALEVLFGKDTNRRKRSILGEMMDNFDGTMEEMESLSDYVEGLKLDESLVYEEVVY